MKILIAGGAGFIGSHLSHKLLAEGHEVVCVDNFVTGQKTNIQDLEANPSFTFIFHDIAKAPMPDDLSADAVFHLASPASPNHHSKLSYHALPMETMLVNTRGTLELLKFAEKNNAKFLFASTSEVYGDPEVHPQPEDYRGNVSTTGPRSVYDESKRFGETLTAYFWRDRKVDARIARIFNTYGPNMHLEDMRMLVRFAIQALKDEPITIFGDGTQTRSLCYVDDLVEGLSRLMFYDNTNHEIVNLGSSDEHTVYEYAQMVKDITDSKSEIALTESLPKDDPLRRRADITKARELLEWEPKTSLNDGITKMIEYIRPLI